MSISRVSNGRRPGSVHLAAQDGLPRRPHHRHQLADAEGGHPHGQAEPQPDHPEPVAEPEQQLERRGHHIVAHQAQRAAQPLAALAPQNARHQHVGAVQQLVQRQHHTRAGHQLHQRGLAHKRPRDPVAQRADPGEGHRADGPPQHQRGPHHAPVARVACADDGGHAGGRADRHAERDLEHEARQHVHHALRRQLVRAHRRGEDGQHLERQRLGQHHQDARYAQPHQRQPVRAQLRHRHAAVPALVPVHQRHVRHERAGHGPEREDVRHQRPVQPVPRRQVRVQRQRQRQRRHHDARRRAELALRLQKPLAALEHDAGRRHQRHEAQAPHTHGLELGVVREQVEYRPGVRPHVRQKQHGREEDERALLAVQPDAVVAAGPERQRAVEVHRGGEPVEEHRAGEVVGGQRQRAGRHAFGPQPAGEVHWHHGLDGVLAQECHQDGPRVAQQVHDLSGHGLCFRVGRWRRLGAHQRRGLGVVAETVVVNVVVAVVRGRSRAQLRRPVRYTRSRAHLRG